MKQRKGNPVAMTTSRQRFAFRLMALLTAGSTLAACAPVGSGPYQAQANNAAYACQQGIQEACYDYQNLAPAANYEAAQQQHQNNAVVGTAVAAGVLGAVAGAAIAGSGRDRGYRGRGYYRDRHYGPRHYRRW
jgi:hypothetical protein